MCICTLRTAKCTREVHDAERRRNRPERSGASDRTWLGILHRDRHSPPIPKACSGHTSDKRDAVRSNRRSRHPHGARTPSRSGTGARQRTRQTVVGNVGKGVNALGALHGLGGAGRSPVLGDRDPASDVRVARGWHGRNPLRDVLTDCRRISRSICHRLSRSRSSSWIPVLESLRRGKRALTADPVGLQRSLRELTLVLHIRNR